MDFPAGRGGGGDFIIDLNLFKAKNNILLKISKFA